MLIISKRDNKDYYDGVVGTMGIDKTIVYKRQIQEYYRNSELGAIPQDIFNLFGNFRCNSNFKLKKDVKYHSFYEFIIAFCGKLYIGFKLYYVNDDKKNFTYSDDFETKITYDIEFMKSIIDENKSWGEKFDDIYKNLKNQDVIKLHRKYNSPILIMDTDYGRTQLEGFVVGNYDKRFIVNGELKDYQFYKVFDSFLAFQEISMFLSGGVLGKNQNKIIEVEDKYKIEQHGFDKWSFRKEPTKNIKK